MGLLPLPGPATQHLLALKCLAAARAAFGSGKTALECVGPAPSSAGKQASSATGDGDIPEFIRAFQVHAPCRCQPWKFCQLYFNNKAGPADCKIIERRKPCKEGTRWSRFGLERRQGSPEHGELGWGTAGEREPPTAGAGFTQPFQLRVSRCFTKEISIVAFVIPSG